MPIVRMWDLVEDVVTRAELRAAVALIHEVAPPGLDPEQEWQAAGGPVGVLVRGVVGGAIGGIVGGGAGKALVDVAFHGWRKMFG